MLPLVVLTSQEASRLEHWKLRKIKKSDPNSQTRDSVHLTGAQLELPTSQGAKAEQQKSGMLKSWVPRTQGKAAQLERTFRKSNPW